MTKARILANIVSTGSVLADGSVAATGITGAVPIASGGTGATTRQDAINALAGALTAGHYLRGHDNGVAMSGILAEDVPTLNQNTTGSAATLTTPRTISITGDVAYTSGAFDGSSNTTGVATLSNSGVTAGTYGSDTNIPQLAVDSKGRVTSVTNVAVSIPSGALTFTGDVTGTGSTGATTDLTLAATGTAGTYTKVTTDSKGRVTSGTTLAAADIPALDASKITSGTIDAARLPSYVDDVVEAANLAGFPTTGETGKIYVAIDTNKTYRWSGSTYVYITSGAVDSVAGRTGVVTLTSSDVGLGSVENKSSATIRSEITSTNVTSALGFTPYNSTNPSGYITSSASITGNAATATSVPWTGISSGSRTNYQLGLQAPGSDYAGFYFSKSTSAATASDAGYFLIKGAGDNFPPYTSEGITLVSDANSLNLFARGSTLIAGGNAWVRMGTGSSETFRLMSDYSYSLNSSRAPIFYDSNDTAYYVDPNSQSRINRLVVSGGDSSSATQIVQAAVYPMLDFTSDSTDSNNRNWRLAGVFNSYGLFQILSSTTPNGTPSTPRFNLSGATGYLGLGEAATSPNRQLTFSSVNEDAIQIRRLTTSQGAPAAGTGISWTWTSASTDNETWAAIRATMPGSTNSFLTFSTTPSGGGGAGLTSRMQIADTGSVTAFVDARAPIFYDSNDTSYYLDPNSFSRMSYGNFNAAPSGRTLSLGGDQVDRVYNDPDRSSLVINGPYYPHLYINATANNGNTNHGAVLSMTGNLSAGGYRRWGMGIANTNPDCFSWGYYDNNPNPHYGVGGGFGYTDTNSKMWLNTSGSLWTTGDMRSPIFYDSNDTAYYVDPRSASVLSGLKLNGVDNDAAGSGSDAILWINKPNNNDWGMILTGALEYGIDLRMAASHSYAIRAMANGSEYSRLGSDLFYHSASVRAPIFYDYNDTNYYVDPATNSNLAALSISSTTGNTTKLEVSGSTGQLFSVTDSMTGTIFSVNDISGIPSIEVLDTGLVKIAQYSGNVVLGSSADNTTDKLQVNGSVQATTIKASTDARAPLFYDQNDTGYYIDPNGSSLMSSLNVNGNFRANFINGGGGTTFTANHYSMGKDYANGSWSHPHYGDLIIGYHTGIRLGANYSGIRFYADSPTTDANNDGNGDSGEALLMTVGGYAGGSGVLVNNTLTAGVDVRAPIFYDSNNTGYYLDPNSGSRLNTITTDEIYNYGWFRTYESNEGMYNQATGQHWYSDSANYWNMGGGGVNGQGIKFRDNHDGTVRGYVYYDQSNNIGFLNQDGSWRLRVVGGDYSQADGSSMRAPLYYDSNNTGYYLDLNGSSNAATNLYGLWYFTSNRDTSSSDAPLQAYSSGGSGAIMSFHRGGYYAVNMGLDSDNVFRIGGWSASTNRLQMDMSGNLTMAGNVTAYSDIRLKENIEVIANAVDRVKQIRGVTFTRNDDENKTKRHAGVIAQEVEMVLPEVVSTDNSGIKNVAYGNMVGLLVEAIKEQQNTLTLLIETVKQQQNQINELKKLLEK